MDALPPVRLWQVIHPHLQGSGNDAVRILGRLLNFDQNMSLFRNVACASCHMPYAGFSGPIPSVNLTMVGYPGSFHYRAGKRAAQRYTYSPISLRSNTMQHKAHSLAETSGMPVRPATNCRVPTPSRHSVRRSILRKWAFLTRLASRFGYPRSSIPAPLRAGLGRGFPHPLAGQHRGRSAPPPKGRRYSAAAPRRFRLSPEDRTKANNIYDHWGQLLSNPRTLNRISARSHRNSTPS